MTDSQDLRAGRAARVLHHYERVRTGFDPIVEPSVLLAELLEDLMYWSQRENVSFAQATTAAEYSRNQTSNVDEAGER